MRNVKRALSLVLVLALALTMCVVGAGAAKYSDVPSTYAYSSEVQFLSDIEVITGYPDGTFKPENTITRGEAAAVIFRTLAGKESAAQNYQGGTQFSDVSAEHWASGYVNFCTEMGIINGYPDGTFKPDQTVTYAEYVTMLARALGLDIGKDLSYPYGYIAEATVEGINYGVDLGANDPA
ncbi:MAG: S-layer homology domain-containing protein, partial [Clostridia bacterium]|nr:S-layer homology domain-containing protein [Clostridia bacterium]